MTTNKGAAAHRSPFGALLREFRLAAGLSQEALAERALVSVHGVSSLERGISRVPQRETLARLIAALSLNAEQQREIEKSIERPSRPRSISRRRTARKSIDIFADGGLRRLRDVAKLQVGRGRHRSGVLRPVRARRGRGFRIRSSSGRSFRYTVTAPCTWKRWKKRIVDPMASAHPATTCMTVCDLR
jgi:transcriptional regulator with XRE-family HTH domain